MMGTLETIRGTEIEKSKSANSDTLYFLGGVALCVVGAGLVLSSPVVKQYLAKAGVGDLMKGAIPDLERYLRIRGM
jgi:hypothetical protein